MWPRLVAQLTAAGEEWLRGALEPQRAIAQALHAQILELDARITAVAAATVDIPLPHGLGQLTALTACVEVMDWQRFSNRKKVGSYLGCAPSESSTGADGQLRGGIDRQGNRRLRSLLTEAVYRLLRWEPRWRAFAKWGPIIQSHGSSVRKKKAVIACVRLLFIDLRRLFTHRATLGALGALGASSRASRLRRWMPRTRKDAYCALSRWVHTGNRSTEVDRDRDAPGAG